ncbi:protein arginine N-methyltransferase 5 [Ceratobasidium sp. AG-Ba]|nr:protein arginine N-methyltransferase 5 [Ceratobasidium sp. AG-Ba]QRW04067.1 protein arginine N-methyltransferase 5 [Ceratobasidium sp. AG-Ba]
MRSVQLPEPVDILVSELLGSFGDNELSPECLDGAMRLLKPEGISIPASYTAYLAPLSASKLYSDPSGTLREIKGAETPYVVMLHAVNILSEDGGNDHPKCGAKIQDCWDFEHPRTHNVVLDPQGALKPEQQAAIFTLSSGLPFTNTHNTRSCHLTFRIPHAGLMHGLAGYFEAVLYKDVGISIHPDRMATISPNMLSWFPIFFPFKEPLYLPANSELDVYMWRLTDTQKVWYEWIAESFLPSVVRSKDTAEAGSNTLGGSLNNQTIPSPMMDAPPGWGHSRTVSAGSAEHDRELRIKIGQTALHNPGGRSSWIGL